MAGALVGTGRADAAGSRRQPKEGTLTTTIDRRKFLAAGGVTAAAAAAAGGSGELLLSKRLRARPPAANGAAPAPTRAPELEIAPMTPLPADETLTIPGLSPFYTPESTFYRVDTALVVPQVTASTWQLRIHGMVDKPMILTFDDLIQRPMVEHDVTLTCVSEAVGGGYIGNARWQGILLADVLREAGIQSGADQIVMRDVKGMTIGVATDPVLDGRKSMLAVGMNGQLLPAEHGYPVRAVIPGLYGYVSATKWVVDMELTTFGAFDAYWVKQGWSQQGPIKTESRIDVPKGSGAGLATGQVTIAGVAWAQHRGIEAVEVSVDGIWYDAKLAVQDTIDTWRQWYYVWDATPGPHVLQVRATDQTGYTQTAMVHRTEPNGATGYHTVKVNVT
jgi:DMSO/TMAO reductase YedYZ molybdopterin-dependent catalytic subunit